jgi:hypothetical protein
MEYGCDLNSITCNDCTNDSICDDNFMRYVGYDGDNYCLKRYFSSDTIRTISSKVTELLDGVCSYRIGVTDRVICHVMSQVYSNFSPNNTGDIYTRYIIPDDSVNDSVQQMIDYVIEFIVSQKRTEYEMLENNAKLSIWDTVLGSFNKQGLRSHSIIKTRERRPDPMMFNMNY